MYPQIRCPTCNNCVGELIEIYNILKNDKYEKELKKIYKNNYNPNQIEIDSIIDVDMSDIFEFLNIKRYCCKRIFVTNTTFDSLLYASKINN